MQDITSTAIASLIVLMDQHPLGSLLFIFLVAVLFFGQRMRGVSDSTQPVKRRR
jgi:hypothetical protein